MEPEDPLRPRGGGRDVADAQGAGIGREDRVRRRRFVEGTEDRPLEIEILECGLDDHVGLLANRVERVPVAQQSQPAIDPLVDAVGVELESGSAPRRAPP